MAGNTDSKHVNGFNYAVTNYKTIESLPKIIVDLGGGYVYVPEIDVNPDNGAETLDGKLRTVDQSVLDEIDLVDGRKFLNDIGHVGQTIVLGILHFSVGYRELQETMVNKAQEFIPEDDVNVHSLLDDKSQSVTARLKDAHTFIEGEIMRDRGGLSALDAMRNDIEAVQDIPEYAQDILKLVNAKNSPIEGHLKESIVNNIVPDSDTSGQGLGLFVDHGQ